MTDEQTTPKPRRKTHTSAAVKARWNKAHYKQFNCFLRPELAEQISSYCADRGLSRPEFLSLALSELTKRHI